MPKKYWKIYDNLITINYLDLIINYDDIQNYSKFEIEEIEKFNNKKRKNENQLEKYIDINDKKNKKDLMIQKEVINIFSDNLFDLI